MCGIVGAISDHNIEGILIDGLKRLEYRGYDSAGLAILNSANKLERLRKQGKVRELAKQLSKSKLSGNAGIAHTRWATHGAPSVQNAHPLMSNEEFVIVHNGIIENHDELKQSLIDKGYEFSSDTDSETIVHLLHHYFKTNKDFLKAVQKTVADLKGAYSIGVLSVQDPNHIIAVRSGSPLVIGKGKNENFFASDPLALTSVADEFIFLEDGDIANITIDEIKIYDVEQNEVKRNSRKINIATDTTERGEHRHFMSKEIFEQPQAVLTNLEGRINNDTISDEVFGLQAKDIFPKVKHVQFVACGTSYHAAMVAKYWLESIAGIACSVEIASEFRYRKAVISKDSLFVTLSQSGETADTLAALKLAKEKGFLGSLTICNVPESSLVRESDLGFMMRAGVEIGVASTKAFTTQLTALIMLTVALGKHNGLNPEKAKHIVNELRALPNIIKSVLTTSDKIADLATFFADKNHALFLGRGALYPIALEGALKLKEISYIHAEGYPAGELKHGPLALVDKNMPVITVAPSDELLEKLKSNMHEVRSRGGELFVFTDDANTKDSKIHTVEMPQVDPILAPIVYTIPLQLLSYHVAILKGTDVDQPRNLAKSVTVE